MSFFNSENQDICEYGEGGTRSPPATPHRLQNPKWPPGGPKMADGVWKGVYPQVFGHSKHLSLNKFSDPSTPSLLVGDHPWWVAILGLVADRVWKGVYL